MLHLSTNLDNKVLKKSKVSVLIVTLSKKVSKSNKFLVGLTQIDQSFYNLTQAFTTVPSFS